MINWIDPYFDIVGFNKGKCPTLANMYFIELISDEIPFTRANPWNNRINITTWHELRKYFLEEKFPNEYYTPYSL